MRLALVDFDGAKAMAALEARPTDEPGSPEFLQMHCAGVLDGVRRLIAWLGSEEPALPRRKAPEALPEPAA